MAKVGKQIFNVDGSYIECEIHYTQKKGFEIRGLKDEVWKFHPDERQPSSKTEDGSIDAAYVAISEYKKHIKSKKKVILVDLQLGDDYLYNKSTFTGGSSWDVGNPKHGLSQESASKMRGTENFHRIPPFALGFTYKVVFLVEKDVKKFYNIAPDDSIGTECSHDKKPEKSLYIDYSTEAEVFMRNTANTFELLAGRLAEFFGDSNLDQKILTAVNNKLLNP